MFFKMSGHVPLLALLVCLCLCSVPSHVTSARSLSHLVNQQPLLFGRRGINPNMNSLFFGKRTSADTPSIPVAMDDIRHACARVWIAGSYLTKSSASACSAGACSTQVKELACHLLYNSNIQVARSHPSGKLDNTFAYNNLVDTCNGQKASRSSYSCKKCLSGAPRWNNVFRENSLDYLTTLPKTYSNVYITELAGACHNCSSGSAVDLRVRNTTAAQRQGYKYICSWMGGRGIDEGDHVHCQF